MKGAALLKPILTLCLLPMALGAGCAGQFTDGDGDGVADAVDPCPEANPDDVDGDGLCDSQDSCLRGDDTDGDGDGVADACDPCPLDNPNDPDGDGSCGLVGPLPPQGPGPNIPLQSACGGDAGVCGPDGDADGDGFSNLFEEESGCDPLDARSRPDAPGTCLEPPAKP